MKTKAVELMLSVKTARTTLVPIHRRWRGAVRREPSEKGADWGGHMKRFDCAQAPQQGSTPLGSDVCAPDRRAWLIFAFPPFS